MCGISGLVGPLPAAAARDAVRRMTDALAHRGPDSDGVECWPTAVFGHRRLSIFDLSAAGRQPMLSADRTVGVAFNGAIYNFKALRDELRARGHEFHSETDTEVLVEGYRAWGIDALVARLRGMFAFALWDEGAGRLFLVRDRLGVKPLAYVHRDRVLAFASTPRALRAAGLADELDPQAVADFLEFGYVTEARTIYAEARKLPAAHIAEWRDGTITLRRYWSPPEPGSAPPMSFDDAVAHTEELLLDAVRLRLEADVPVGALLSGGIDSGLVCWAIARLGGDVTAYTVGTPGHAADESAAATATARELGIRHQLLDYSTESADAVGELVEAYAEPFAVGSALGMLRVSQAIARSGVKVLLTGDGGDDVFLGYERHRHLLMAQRVATLTPGAAAAAWPLLRRVIPRRGAARRAANFLDYATGGLGAYLDAHDGLPFYHRRGLLGPRLANATVEQRGMPRSVGAARRVLRDYLAHDLGTQFVAEYLTKVDGATMWYALEARSPFLDQRVWEFAASLPLETRLHGGRLKPVLRELARRHIGERVAVQRKQGFAVPVQAWMAGRWRGAVEAAFGDSLLARGGWVDAGAVLRELRRVPEGGDAPLQLWYLYVLETWLRADAAAHGETAAAAASTAARATVPEVEARSWA